MSLNNPFLMIRDLLIEQGWIQGHAYTSEGYCMFGAMTKISREHNIEDYDTVKNILHQTCLEEYGVWNISMVNDNYMKSIIEPIGILERCALTYEL